MMSQKHEWRKKEKTPYLPNTKPELIYIPKYKFIVISGQGNPNNEFFGAYIEVLYSLSYAIKMTLKKMASPPEGYMDYTVYPLEGVWDINEKAKKNFTGVVDKDDFVFDLMIRQPNFITNEFYQEMLELTKKKKPQNLLSETRFLEIEEGECIQMMHIGSYDDESKSFAQMEAYAKSIHRERASKVHREVYLSDFRKVAPEKLKTVLRFKVI